MDYKLVSGGGSPLSAAAFKDQVRISSAAEDSYIDRLCQSATLKCEEYTRRSFLNTVWTLSMDEFPDGKIEIKKNPLVSVASIYYKNIDGVNTLWAASNYQVYVKREPGLIALEPGASYPSTEADRLGAVTITFTAGYGTGNTDVPVALRQAIAILAAHYFENREMVTVGVGSVADIPMPSSVYNILNDYSLRGFQ